MNEQTIVILGILVTIGVFLLPLWELIFKKDATGKRLHKLSGYGIAALIICIGLIIVGIGGYHLNQQAEKNYFKKNR